MARAHLDPEAWAKKVRIWWTVGITLGAVLVVSLTVLWLVRNVIRPNRRYSLAEDALEQGNLSEAIDRFSAMRGYQDAWERAVEIFISTNPDADVSQTILNAELGEVVTFGHWEQNGNLNDGPEPIRWIVLYDDKDRVLLWSEQALDSLTYHEIYEPITWADCSLRAWLNNAFYTEAFTREEQLRVSMTCVENVDNPASGADGGENTEDHVFILSFNEILAYCVYNPVVQDITATPTPYVLQQGMDPHRELGTVAWWTRTPGMDQSCVTYCDMSGSPLYSTNVNRTGMGVRPALWVFVPGRTQTTFEP